MPRIARKSFDSTYFHVLIQGIAREYVFGSDRLKDAYIDNLNKFKDEFGVKILGYCIMDNHAHFLLFTPNTEMLSKFMLKVNSRFAQYYNYTSERVGYVFRDRFKSQPIFDSKYLFNCLNYIHRNPVSAGIVQKYDTYKYSSYNCYMSGVGIIDFAAASELYDCSPNSIAAMHEDLNRFDDGCPVWLDSDEEMKSVKERKTMAILRNLHVPPQYVQLDKELLVQTTKSLRNVGLSFAEIGEILDISTSWVRKIMKG